MEFINEFVQVAASGKKRQSALHLSTFAELHKEDKDNISDLLSSFGITFV